MLISIGGSQNSTTLSIYLPPPHTDLLHQPQILNSPRPPPFSTPFTISAPNYPPPSLSTASLSPPPPPTPSINPKSLTHPDCPPPQPFHHLSPKSPLSATPPPSASLLSLANFLLFFSSSSCTDPPPPPPPPRPRQSTVLATEALTARPPPADCRSQPCVLSPDGQRRVRTRRGPTQAREVWQLMRMEEHGRELGGVEFYRMTHTHRGGIIIE
ncbi:proline-rich receptor-like protein kinase PERK8 [Phoenix dactylifera]|uniref:Proline-rich receptor-like protein kinase PERK8 n=1 Tax=Phoenix dactylifera TaxID=42345 RepID=A0A8B9AE44_PHODC|nr:proline-rich receptor-like protein kinase PERK8 [Phoenix dactylifera]